MADDKNRGLYEKYHVERNDGKPIERGCIVLEWDDPNARVGIAAFMQAAREAGYIQLAHDLERQLKRERALYHNVVDEDADE